MGFVGVLIGFVGGMLVGLTILALIFGGGRHVLLMTHPALKTWSVVFDLVLACIMAWLGYQLLGRT